MNTKVWCLALLYAATAIVANGCGGGGSSTPSGMSAETARAAQPVSTGTATPPGDDAEPTRNGAHGVQTSGEPRPMKLDAPSALRPLSPSPFPRETTYRMYAGNGSRKLLRLDFGRGRYEVLDDGDSSGHSTSGSFSEDASEPGTYVFDTARTASAFNTARFRLAQGGVVGGFPFETRSSGMTGFGVQPFVAANDFVLSAAQLDGDYNRMGLRHLASLGLPIGQTMALRISGGGTVLELCRDETVHRLENCSTITRYALSFDASDEAWTARSISSSDRIAFRMARIAGRNVWLEAGMALDGTPAVRSRHIPAISDSA